MNMNIHFNIVIIIMGPIIMIIVEPIIIIIVGPILASRTCHRSPISTFKRQVRNTSKRLFFK